MNKVNQMFGLYTNAKKFPDLKMVLKEQICPYMGRKCYKTRKSDPDIAIGTCSLCFNKVGQPILICPEPLTQGGRIFTDCIPFVANSIAGSDLYLVPEVTIDVGRIDYMLVTAKNGVPIDFVAIELQTLDTTGSIWNERQDMLRDNGYDVEEGEARSKSASLNWKMTGKTILAQLVQKSQLFAYMNKNLVLVCQTPLYDNMAKNFNFSGVHEADSRDVMHFHLYDFVEDNNTMVLKLNRMRSASLETVEAIIGDDPKANYELEKILDVLKRRICPEYLFNPINL